MVKEVERGMEQTNRYDMPFQVSSSALQGDDSLTWRAQACRWCPSESGQPPKPSPPHYTSLKGSRGSRGSRSIRAARGESSPCMHEPPHVDTGTGIGVAELRRRGKTTNSISVKQASPKHRINAFVAQGEQPD